MVGDTLPGARGLTPADQVRIDRTVARLCAANVYTRAACARHTEAARAARADHQNASGV